MSNLENERISRMLFRQKQLQVEKEKKKYPATNGQITEKNINDYFVFYDLTEITPHSPKSLSTSSNSYKETKNNLDNEEEIKKIDYDIASFVDNEETPDLYTPFGKISGNNYDLNIDSDIINAENSDYIEIKTISKKRLRYFDLDHDTNETPEIIITKLPKPKENKKHNYWFKHKSRTPLNEKKMCYICLSMNHDNKEECDKYKRCIKCLKYGHWAKNCEEIIQNKCPNCHVSAHNKEDCLQFNDGITIEDLLLNRNKGLKCPFCYKKTHVICPFSLRENFIINSSNGNNEQNKKEIKDFSKTLFCPLCAGNHLLKDCPENQEQKNINNDINSMNEKSEYNLDIFNDDKNNNDKNQEKIWDNSEINLKEDNINNNIKITPFKNNWKNKEGYNSYKIKNGKYMNNKRVKGTLYDRYKNYKNRNGFT